MPSSPAAPLRVRRPVARRAALVAALALSGAVAPAAAHAADPPDLRPYYAIFARGGTEIPGHDTYWTPQGLAYWPEQDALVISYYDSTGKQQSRLAVIDRASGVRKKLLVMPTTGHVGGLAMSKNYLWVANNGRAVRFSKKALLAKKSMSPLKSSGGWSTKASSYMTIVGDRMWVGQYEKSRGATAYRYHFGKGGIPRFDGTTMRTPSQVQGMAITGSTVIWSRSTGRDNRSKLEIRPTSRPTGSGRTITAPNMSEGIVLARGELHVLYESGSRTYADADYRVRTVHHGPIAKVLGG